MKRSRCEDPSEQYADPSFPQCQHTPTTLDDGVFLFGWRLCGEETYRSDDRLTTKIKMFMY